MDLQCWRDWVVFCHFLFFSYFSFSSIEFCCWLSGKIFSLWSWFDLRVIFFLFFFFLNLPSTGQRHTHTNHTNTSTPTIFLCDSWMILAGDWYVVLPSDSSPLYFFLPLFTFSAFPLFLRLPVFSLLLAFANLLSVNYRHHQSTFFVPTPFRCYIGSFLVSSFGDPPTSSLPSSYPVLFSSLAASIHSSSYQRVWVTPSLARWLFVSCGSHIITHLITLARPTDASSIHTL